MKRLQWLLIFICCLLFFSSQTIDQTPIPSAKLQSSFYKKPADQPKEIHATSNQTISKGHFQSFKIPFLPSKDEPHFPSLNTKFLKKVNTCSIYLLKLDILASKHHPPTA